MADIPVTREEKYLAYLTGDYKADIPKPITRQERYLYELCLKGMGGEISPEEIQKAVNDYLDKNPVKPGATTEQAQQIEQNKKDVNSLKESMASKITKFYASSQGETHLADSDDGKIMDMMVYGKSEQKQYSGKNLINGVHSSFLKGAIMFDIDKVIVNGTISEELGASFSKIQLKAGTYTLSSSFNCISKIGINPNLGILNADNKFKTLTINEDMEINLVVIVPSGSHNSIDYIMLNEGSDALPWEPYTGGQPSPNPSYPQEIKSVVNPTVKVCGKNLLNIEKISPTKNTEINDDGSITVFPTAYNSGSSIGLFSHICSNYEIGEKYILSLVGKLEQNTFYAVGENKRYTFDIAFTLTQELIDSEIYLYGKETKSKVTNIMLRKETDSGIYEPYHEQTVTLPYDLYGVKVASGGNVTIDDQQYVSDYFDVERGKLVRLNRFKKITSNDIASINDSKILYAKTYDVWDSTNYVQRALTAMSNIGEAVLITVNNAGWNGESRIEIRDVPFANVDEAKSYFGTNDVYCCYPLATPEEIDLTPEEIAALKALATYYPVTNISVNSEQLDGYTVFNYPISMENGWNYVKKQLNDNRDYIYDMDARTQDTDLQAAEAYVNSEYAVALTELEV